MAVQVRRGGQDISTSTAISSLGVECVAADIAHLVRARDCTTRF